VVPQVFCYNIKYFVQVITIHLNSILLLVVKYNYCTFI